MMTLDEAIENAEQCASSEVCDDCADEHAQLADWLRELRQARMKIDLLKILRDGFKADAQMYKDENAKLRELVKGAVEVASFDDVRDWPIGYRMQFIEQARELGIEIDDD